MSKSRRVYPVEGRWLNDVPHVPHDCDDKRCVESGAFTTEAPKPDNEGTKAEASEE